MKTQNSYLFKFAWRSIRRNFGRSFFIGFSVSIAVVIAVWVVAFFDGLNAQIEKAVVNTNTGYYQVQEPLYAKTTDSSNAYEWNSSLAQKLTTSPITAASPELILDGNISTPEGAAGLAVIGVSPSLHSDFLPISSHLIAGAFLNEKDIGHIVIGEELARIFKFNVGDQLILNYQDVKGELRSEILSIKGIYHFNGKSFQKRFVYVNQPTWQSLYFNEVQDKILFNRVTLMLPGLGEEQELTKKLTGTDLVLKSWKNLNPEMAVILEFHDGMIRFFFLIIGITILMTILTPVRMLWQERYEEMRMLAIIGVSKNKFWKIGIYEVFQMIILSGVFSSLLLVIIIGIQSLTGIDFRFLNDEGISIERAGIKLPGIIYPQLSIEQLVITFTFVIFVLSTSYLWSIHRTLKKLEAEI